MWCTWVCRGAAGCSQLGVEGGKGNSSVTCRQSTVVWPAPLMGKSAAPPRRGRSVFECRARGSVWPVRAPTMTQATEQTWLGDTARGPRARAGKESFAVPCASVAHVCM